MESIHRVSMSLSPFMWTPPWQIPGFPTRNGSDQITGPNPPRAEHGAACCARQDFRRLSSSPVFTLLPAHYLNLGSVATAARWPQFFANMPTRGGRKPVLPARAHFNSARLSGH